MHQKKPVARLDIGQIKVLSDITGVPLVLHGGSGIDKEYVRSGIAAGIAKINVGTEIRQAYLRVIEGTGGDIAAAQDAVYLKVREVISVMLGLSNTRAILFG